MIEAETIPECCREGYARLIVELVKLFSTEKISGEAIVRFKEGKPMEVEPRPRIHLIRTKD